MSNAHTIKSLRREYLLHELDENSVARDPFDQFSIWFKEITEVSTGEVNAMAVATSDASGAPSVRTILLKEFDATGFTFFTNYESRKGRELSVNPRVSLLFYWSELERQVRIDGTAAKLSREANAAYFSSRPEGARIGATVSAQSSPLNSRAELERQYNEAESRFLGAEVPCPENWGGYRVVPARFEFWQGRESRLHDRIEFQRSGQTMWNISRLYP